MPSLFTQQEKNDLASLIADIADTWDRDIIVYKSPTEIVAFSNEESFNRFSRNNQNLLTNPQNNFSRSIVKGRVLYDQKLKDAFLTPYVGGSEDEAQLKLKNVDGIARIKIKKEFYDIFSEAKQLELDGFRFNVEGIGRPHGLFDIDYYTFYLKIIK
jgi:hypothetical protein